MSIRNESYLIQGVRLNYQAYSDATDEEQERILDLDFPWCGKDAAGMIGLLIDGMSGEYIIAGRCIAVSNEDEGFKLQSVDYVPAYNHEIKKWMIDNDMMKYLTDEGVKIELLLLTHWH